MSMIASAPIWANAAKAFSCSEGVRTSSIRSVTPSSRSAACMARSRSSVAGLTGLPRTATFEAPGTASRSTVFKGDVLVVGITERPQCLPKCLVIGVAAGHPAQKSDPGNLLTLSRGSDWRDEKAECQSYPARSEPRSLLQPERHVGLVPIARGIQTFLVTQKLDQSSVFPLGKDTLARGVGLLKGLLWT